MASINKKNIISDYSAVLSNLVDEFYNSDDDYSVKKDNLIESILESAEKYGYEIETLKVPVFYATMDPEDTYILIDNNIDLGFSPAIFADIYTVGLERYYNHPEVAIVLNIGNFLVDSIFETVLDNITTDESYTLTPGLYDNILENYSVMVVEGEVTKRLYLLLPDKEGKFPMDEGCNKEFAAQLNIIKYLENIYYKERMENENTDNDV